jgi:hypothetical protein
MGRTKRPDTEDIPMTDTAGAAEYTHGYTPTSDLLIRVGDNGYKVHHAAIIDILSGIRGLTGVVGRRICFAWDATSAFSDGRRHADRTPEWVAKISAKSSGGRWTSRGGMRGTKGNSVGRMDIQRFDSTRTLQAAAVAEAYTLGVVAALRANLTADQLLALAACVTELAARADFIAAYLPLCETEMTVAQRKRSKVLAPGFGGLAEKLRAFAAAI